MQVGSNAKGLRPLGWRRIRTGRLKKKSCVQKLRRRQGAIPDVQQAWGKASRMVHGASVPPSLQARRNCAQDATAKLLKCLWRAHAARTILDTICSNACPTQRKTRDGHPQIHKGTRPPRRSPGSARNRQQLPSGQGPLAHAALLLSFAVTACSPGLHASSAKRAGTGAEVLGFPMLPAFAACPWLSCCFRRCNSANKTEIARLPHSAPRPCT